MELISIIVPVYNVEEYLPACLDSIINQTYKNIEIILVDDGSTDNSSIICDEYAEKDNRIVVIHQENAGVSRARNKGIELCNGDYIIFVDSDDYIAFTHIELLIKPLCIQNYDVVICNFNIVTENHCKKNRECKSISGDLYIDYYYMRHLLSSPCLCIYKKDIIIQHDLKFDMDASFGEDQMFNMKYFIYVNRYYYNKQYTYFYYKRNNESLSKRNYYKDWEYFIERLKFEKYFLGLKNIYKKNDILIEHSLVSLLHFFKLKDKENSYYDFKERLVFLEHIFINKYMCGRKDVYLISNLLKIKAYFLIYCIYAFKYNVNIFKVKTKNINLNNLIKEK